MNPLNLVNVPILWLQEKKLLKNTPGILFDYPQKYPYFQELEKNYEVVQRECKELLSYRDQIHDVQGMGGKGTEGGIHAIKWKSFMFKAGHFIEENCQLCPETTKLLKRIPRIRQAFFSILYPNQYITPHRGYYQGFLRYHLGVIIPDNNKENKCWIRVNDDPIDNKNYDKDTMHKGIAYHWKNGEGIMFNDNYLHDASNETDEIRVVLWIDVVRKFPFWLDWLHLLILKIGYQTKGAKNVAEKAKVDLEKV